jgi:hypothetical protein
MAQMAIRAVPMWWTPLVYSVNWTTGAIVTATIDEKYMRGVAGLPRKRLSQALVVWPQSRDLVEKAGGLAFEASIWRTLMGFC